MIQIIRLYMDAEKAFGVKETRAEDDWTEEDEAAAGDIIEEVDKLEHPEVEPGEDSSDSDDLEGAG